MIKKYTVTKDTDMLAPKWLADRVDYRNIKFLYRIRDGTSELKGVKVGDQIAKIGDTISFDDKRLSVEKTSFSKMQ